MQISPVYLCQMQSSIIWQFLPFTVVVLLEVTVT